MIVIYQRWTARGGGGQGGSWWPGQVGDAPVGPAQSQRGQRGHSRDSRELTFGAAHMLHRKRAPEAGSSARAPTQATSPIHVCIASVLSSSSIEYDSTLAMHT